MTRLPEPLPLVRVAEIPSTPPVMVEALASVDERPVLAVKENAVVDVVSPKPAVVVIVSAAFELMLCSVSAELAAPEQTYVPAAPVQLPA